VRFNEDRWFPIFMIGFAVLVTAMSVIMAIAHNNAKHACEDRGGSYDSYNCHTTFIPMMVSCGSNCTNTILVPEETRDYRCVGATTP
jgi:hypothetical protein